MNNRAKAATLILIVLIIIAFSLAAGIYYLLQNEKSRSASLQTELETTITKYKKSETDLVSANDKISSLTVEVREAQKRLDTLSKELLQEKTAKQDALSKVEQISADVEQLKASKSELENKLNMAQEDAKKIQNQLKELSTQKTDLEEKIKDLEAKTKGVELGKIVVNPEGASIEPAQAVTEDAQPEQAAQKPLSGKEGKVLVINKDYNFAVINLGSKDDVEVGDVFVVYHNNKNIGEVKVEKVHESMAAAGFATAEMKEKAMEGDKVVQKGK